MRRVVFGAGLVALVLGSMAARAATRVLTVVNNDGSKVTGISYAPADTDRWFSMDGEPVSGGAGRVTIAMPPSACVYDFRIRFQGRSPQTIKAWDVCREPVMHVGKMPK